VNYQYLHVKKFAVKRQHKRFDEEVDEVSRKRLASVVESDGRNDDGRCKNGVGIVPQASLQGNSSDNFSDKSSSDESDSVAFTELTANCSTSSGSRLMSRSSKQLNISTSVSKEQDI